jgi:hypothetical protein
MSAWGWRPHLESERLIRAALRLVKNRQKNILLQRFCLVYGQLFAEGYLRHRIFCLCQLPINVFPYPLTVNPRWLQSRLGVFFNVSQFVTKADHSSRSTWEIPFFGL